MSETLETFIVRRRGELDRELSALEEQKAALEAELTRVNQVAIMFGSRSDDPALTAALPPAGMNLIRERSPKRMSEVTIKTMVLEVLAPPCVGATALEILEKINNKIDVPYPRTSLSPQLSRLKTEGKIHREGLVWKSGPSLEVDNNEDDDGAEDAALEEQSFKTRGIFG